MNAVHAVLRALKEMKAEIMESASFIRRAMHKILMRVKGSIPVLDGVDDADHPRQAATFTTPHAASINRVGAVSDAYAREYARSVFDYDGGFCDLYEAILDRGEGKARGLRPALTASAGLDSLGLRLLFAELPAGAAEWRALAHDILLWQRTRLTRSQIVCALLPALQSAAQAYTSQKATEAAHADDDGGQAGAAAPPAQARPHGRHKKDDDDEPPEGPKGP